MSSNPSLNRISQLLDEGSFQQILAGVEQHGADMPKKAGDGVFAGLGKISGRDVAVAAHDPTFAGGSLGEVGLRKIAKLYELAARLGIPVIVLTDSSGARLQEGARSLLAVGELIKTANAAHGKIPQVNVVFGGGVGGAAFTAAVGDVVIGVSKTGYMFLHGPRAVKHALGQDVTVMELGSVKSLAETSGMIHFLVEEETEAISLVKTILSYLPSNSRETPPASAKPIYLPKTTEQPTETRKLIDEIIDAGTFLEFHSMYAKNLVVGLGRVDGLVVGVVANEPQHFNGYIDIKACIKLSHFVNLCSNFNIPVLTIVDTPGFEPGVAAEHNGIIREGVDVYKAYLNASVPKITLLAGKAYGGAFIAMCSKGIGADYVFAFPTAEAAVQPLEISAEILFRKELEKLSGEERAKAFSQYVENLRKIARGEALLAMGVADEIVSRENVKKSISAIMQKMYTNYVKYRLKH
ncbi:MAG: methylmalonyl-CoA carboxyltransferase [Candidatus Caldarchaeum sp.]|nr:methylmalonyl-CoA carboxyltransferase [Candidatus Caldarchaeum sp.]MDW8434772.1 carboxyl transferase domain-containing protein [Candidatus Caldarchaeum sp.]